MTVMRPGEADSAVGRILPGPPGSIAIDARRIRSRTHPGALLEFLDSLPGAILLESTARHQRYGRWTLAAFDPVETVQLTGGRLLDSGGRCLAGRNRDLWAVLGELLAPRCGPAPPCPYGPGWFGYLGYELGRTIEQLPGRAERDLHLPDLHLGLYDVVAAYDTVENQWWLLWLTGGNRPDRIGQKLDRWQELLAQAPAGDRPEGLDAARADVPVNPAAFASNFTPDQYRRAVARCVEYIAAGDIFQVNLSQRLSVPDPPSDLAIYRRLRRRNPAWYAAWMRLQTPAGTRALCSCSPELFLRQRGRQVVTRPIKGTRPRTGRAGADAAAADDLLASGKDNAELAMIIDLLRNDLGRQCRYGSVRVAQARALETHPTVYHLVGTVVGQLLDTSGPAALLRATFPGGSITGAPKIRAMEIIDQLEGPARGPYTGCIGTVGLNGNAEWNIAIRTVVHTPQAAYVQVGGGIVAESDPQSEYDETMDKARAMLEAIQLARQGN
jgi:para-aminobenzoate synthetase component 1